MNYRKFATLLFILGGRFLERFQLSKLQELCLLFCVVMLLLNLPPNFQSWHFSSKSHVNVYEHFVVGSTLHGKLIFQVLVLGANGLIRATSAPLDDCFLRNILGIFLQMFFKKSLKKIICIILLRFVLNFCQKNVIFKVLQNPFTSPFTILKQWSQVFLHYFWRSKKVNGIISYFKHL